MTNDTDTGYMALSSPVQTKSVQYWSFHIKSAKWFYIKAGFHG